MFYYLAEDIPVGDMPRWVQTLAQLGFAGLALWYLVRVHIPSENKRADIREANARQDSKDDQAAFLAALEKQQQHCERSHIQ